MQTPPSGYRTRTFLAAGVCYTGCAAPPLSQTRTLYGSDVAAPAGGISVCESTIGHDLPAADTTPAEPTHDSGPPNPWFLLPASATRRPGDHRQQRDVHLHLVLAHGRRRPVRPGQHRLLHRRHRRAGHRPGRPWFILAVMVFSYAVRSVYIESCSLFVRGGVYASSRRRWAASSPSCRSRP